jgi:hypothetical protein
MNQVYPPVLLKWAAGSSMVLRKLSSGYIKFEYLRLPLHVYTFLESFEKPPNHRFVFSECSSSVCMISKTSNLRIEMNVFCLSGFCAATKNLITEFHDLRAVSAVLPAFPKSTPKSLKWQS